MSQLFIVRNKLYDASQANVIARPRTDEEVMLETKAWIKLVIYLKAEKPSAGVLLDLTKVLQSSTSGEKYSKLENICKSFIFVILLYRQRC